MYRCVQVCTVGTRQWVSKLTSLVERIRDEKPDMSGEKDVVITTFSTKIRGEKLLGTVLRTYFQQFWDIVPPRNYTEL